MDYHEFGGTWTKIKLEILNKYQNAYNTALKKRFNLIYIDAFAGTGKFKPKNETVELPGSAIEALKYDFNEFHYLELSKRKLQKLKVNISSHSNNKRINLHLGDCNSTLIKIISQFKWNDRALIFLDPFGTHLHWRTLEEIAARKNIDVCYLFPLNGVLRQMSVNIETVDKSKTDAINRVIGTDEWINFYSESKQQDLFSEPVINRSPGTQDVLELFNARLRSIFSSIQGPKILYNSKAPLFALYFFLNTDSDSAKRLFNRITKSVLKSSILETHSKHDHQAPYPLFS